MEEKTRAAYLADLDYFQSKHEKSSGDEFYFPVAMLYSNLEKYDEAIKVCQQALANYPDYTQLKVILAESLVNSGRKDEGRDILFDVVVRDEDNYKALKLLGLIFKNENAPKEAVRYLRAAYLKAPEDDELLIWLEELGGLIPEEEDPEAGEDNEPVMEEEEIYNFDTEDNLQVAREAMSDLMKDMPALRPPKKGKHKKVSSEEVLEGEELSDADIMQQLNKAGPPGQLLTLPQEETILPEEQTPERDEPEVPEEALSEKLLAGADLFMPESDGMDFSLPGEPQSSDISSENEKSLSETLLDNAALFEEEAASLEQTDPPPEVSTPEISQPEEFLEESGPAAVFEAAAEEFLREMGGQEEILRQEGEDEYDSEEEEQEPMVSFSELQRADLSELAPPVALELDLPFLAGEDEPEEDGEEEYDGDPLSEPDSGTDIPDVGMSLEEPVEVSPEISGEQEFQEEISAVDPEETFSGFEEAFEAFAALETEKERVEPDPPVDEETPFVPVDLVQKVLEESGLNSEHPYSGEDEVITSEILEKEKEGN